MKKLSVWLTIFLLAVVLVGCAYNHKRFDQARGPLNGENDFVIQLDDYGQLWDRAAADAALARVRKLSHETNTIVVLFVHGWNHDAAPDNENLVDFAKSLSTTRKLLTDPNSPESLVYRRSREALTGTEALTVIGIYVGWRGRSLPSISNYATFWGRKAAAERVGQGDLREFLYELNDIYRQRGIRRAKGEGRQFMGFTSIGHSFGGQVLFRSVVNELENELILATSRGHSSSETQTLGFGDLVVLINPALEAMQFERIQRLASKLSFSKFQSPAVLVVSSAGDVPRQVLFPLGRQVDALLRPDFRDGQRALWTEALGEYEGFRTHSLDILPKDAPRQAFDPAWYLSEQCRIATYDLSNVPAISRVRLVPTAAHKQYSPYIVAYASTEVVLNHSDVFEDELREFLSQYIAITQGKRMLTGDPKTVCK